MDVGYGHDTEVAGFREGEVTRCRSWSRVVGGTGDVDGDEVGDGTCCEEGSLNFALGAVDSNPSKQNGQLLELCSC